MQVKNSKRHLQPTSLEAAGLLARRAGKFSTAADNRSKLQVTKPTSGIRFVAPLSAESLQPHIPSRHFA